MQVMEITVAMLYGPSVIPYFHLNDVHLENKWILIIEYGHVVFSFFSLLEETWKLHRVNHSGLFSLCIEYYPTNYWEENNNDYY